jgi:17beta-estradiol 17-dehydrogenase / very-long-chain 3-oxoacyl-CoA reductase
MTISFLNKILVVAGVTWTSSLVLRLLRFVYIYTRPSSLKRYRHSDDDKLPWALVTGASDGIGRGFAEELAQSGFNVILHGRNQTKLEGVKKQLSKDHPKLSFRIVTADAADSSPEMLKQINKIVESLKDVNLTVLINNVGGPPPKLERLFKTFDENTPSDIDGFMAINNRFTTQLTSAILPQLLRHQPSLIINLGSFADIGMPRLSMYSGAKSFIMGWTAALAREMKAEKRDVEVLGINLSKVTSVSFRKEPVTFFKPDARTFASASLGRVGCGEIVLMGYWPHAIMRYTVGILPEFLFSSLAAKEIRKEAEDDKKRE